MIQKLFRRHVSFAHLITEIKFLNQLRRYNITVKKAAREKKNLLGGNIKDTFGITEGGRDVSTCSEEQGNE